MDPLNWFGSSYPNRLTRSINLSMLKAKVEYDQVESNVIYKGAWGVHLKLRLGIHVSAF